MRPRVKLAMLVKGWGFAELTVRDSRMEDADAANHGKAVERTSREAIKITLEGAFPPRRLENFEAKFIRPKLDLRC